jgi:hypothetical protein
MNDDTPTVDSQSTEENYVRWHRTIPDRTPNISQDPRGGVLISGILGDLDGPYRDKGDFK